MGCFIACFGGAKDRKPKRRGRKKPLPDNNRVNQVYQPLQTSPPAKKVEIKVEDNVPVFEIREKPEQASPKSLRKKVTFDLNVKTYEHVAVDKDIRDSIESELENDEKVKEEEREECKGKLSPDPNYRYQNCDSSDDECIDDDDNYNEDDEYDEDDEFDIDDEVTIVGNEEESYDSYFSLPMDKEKQQQNSHEEVVDSPIPTTNTSATTNDNFVVKASSRDRSQYVHNVLNPVENLSQWEEVKKQGLLVKNQNKENISHELQSTMKEPNKENSILVLEAKAPKKPEISVDASLSTWLVSSENSPQKSDSHWSNSSVRKEEQPILGALTIEDLKHSSVTSSPRKSPSRNPDEIPILGTVGSYWNSKTRNGSETKGTPNSTSKYREDKRVNWHSTPFEVRLERALNKGVSEGCR